MIAGEIGQRDPVFQRQGRIRPQQHVRAGIQQVDDDRTLPPHRFQPLEQPAQRPHQRHQRRVQHQAVGHIDNLGRPLLMQSEHDAAGRPANREVDAAPLTRQAGDKRQRIGRRKTGLPQRIRHQAGFPLR